MKTLITAFAVSMTLLGSMAAASSAPIWTDVPTTFPQDGAFDGKGLKSLIVKQD